MDGNLERLEGVWESGETFGTTALDWTQALRVGAATAELSLARDGAFSLRLLRTANGASEDITRTFRHPVPRAGVFRVVTDAERAPPTVGGEVAGARWSLQLEDDDVLRVRLEAAPRFGRCKGVDVIYFQRARR